MPIPVVYRGVGERGIASYDFFDIASGIGYSTFYAAETASGVYVLTDNLLYSHRVERNAFHTAAATYGASAALYLNFDASFNLPRQMRGDILVNLPLGLCSAFSSEVYYYFPEVFIWQISGDNQTLLGSTSGAIRQTPSIASGTYDYDYNALKINVDRTKLKKDDKLRVRAAIWTRSNSGNNAEGFIGHDPNNRASGAFDVNSFGTARSDFKIHVQFVIDL